MSDVLSRLRRYFRAESAPAFGRVLRFSQVAWEALVTGAISGLVGSAFLWCMEWSQGFFARNESEGGFRVLFLLPFAGLAIVWLYRRAGLSVDAGTDQVVSASSHSGEVPSLLLAPLIFICSPLTQLFGGSAGREGAALQLGGCSGLLTDRLFRKRADSRRTALLCGMAGGFGAVFGAPLGATVFALEAGRVGKISHPALLPALISGLTGAAISHSFGFDHISCALRAPEVGVLLSWGRVVLLGLACGGVSALFCWSLRSARSGLGRLFPNDYARAFFGGVFVVLLTLAVGTTRWNGTGGTLIELSLGGTAAPYDFIMKILFTAATLGACFKGGEIVPALSVGATFGSAFGHALGLDPVLGAGLGMLGVFGGATNCPLAAFVLGIELFGSDCGALMALTCSASYAASGRISLYRSQEFEEDWDAEFGNLKKPEPADIPGGETQGTGEQS